MKKIFFTPGPSELYPTISFHMKKALADHIPSISHRSDAFHDIFQSTENSLKKLLNIPANYYIFFFPSATEIMERLIQSLVAKHSAHFVNGSFSDLFYKIALGLGKQPYKFETPFGNGFDFEQINVPKASELICITQNETSTGVSIPLQYIYNFKKRYPHKLIALDIVSSVPYPVIDFKLLDAVFFSVQKGFGLPAGLGVLILSPQAISVANYLNGKNGSVGSYHALINCLKYYEKKETPETPNVLGIYLLGKVAKDMRLKGIDKLRSDIKNKAQSLYDFFQHTSFYSPFVSDYNFRSATIIVVDIKNGSIKLREKLKKEGLMVGSGYKEMAGKQIRIANFPAHKVADIRRLIYFLKNYSS